MIAIGSQCARPGFEPRQRREKRPEEGMSIGGRGIALVMAFAEELSYRRAGTRNITDFSVTKRGGEA